MGSARNFFRRLRAWFVRRKKPDLLPQTTTILRGLRSSKSVKQNGEIKADAFEPSEKSIDERRTAGYLPAGHDASINWEDEPAAEKLLRSDRKNAAGGVVRVRREFIEVTLATIPEMRGLVVCERRKIDGNPYHGNIVFVEGLPKAERLRAAAYLAIESRLVPEPSDG